MALLVPTHGEEDGLKYFLNHTSAEDLYMRLYTNDITPSESDTTASYTEATFTGYGQKSLTGTSWTVTPGDPSVATYAQQSFSATASTSDNVYGYYVVRQTSGRIAWAERFTNGPYVIQNSGDTINITPRITLD